MTFDISPTNIILHFADKDVDLEVSSIINDLY